MSQNQAYELTPDVADSFKNRLLGNGKSRNTVKMYSYIARQFLEFVNYDRERINLENIERFKEYLTIEKGYSKSSVYLYVRALQSLLNYLEIDSIGHLKAPKRPHKVPNYLTGEEVRSILSSCNDVRERLMVKLLVYTGIRVSELCSLRLNDIDLNGRTIKIRSGKGDKDRLVVFSEEVVPDLRSYMSYSRSVRKGEFLFPTSRSRKISPVTVERIIRSVVARSGVQKKVTPHTFRHTFATSLLRNGADLRIIQVLLGHSSISTTQIYTHLDDNALKMGYSKFIPRY
ncbi:MAG: site-specific tyrosine recombinase/integron integrase [Thermoplasmata archaeon]